MGLRLKIASTITLIFVAVIAATYLLFSQFLLNEFRQLERARTGENLARVFQSITTVKEELRIRSLDWGHWDESYNFLLGNNPGYVESNLNYEALLPFELQHFIYTDNTGHIFHAGELSKAAGSVIALKAQSAQAILQHEKIAAFIKTPTNSALTGLLVV
ncbi:MAG: CHASE4 domain-containing protein, partial [bacterium]